MRSEYLEHKNVVAWEGTTGLYRPFVDGIEPLTESFDFDTPQDAYLFAEWAARSVEWYDYNEHFKTAEWYLEILKEGFYD